MKKTFIPDILLALIDIAAVIAVIINYAVFETNLMIVMLMGYSVFVIIHSALCGIFSSNLTNALYVKVFFVSILGTLIMKPQITLIFTLLNVIALAVAFLFSKMKKRNIQNEVKVTFKNSLIFSLVLLGVNFLLQYASSGNIGIWSYVVLGLTTLTAGVIFGALNYKYSRKTWLTVFCSLTVINYCPIVMMLSSFIGVLIQKKIEKTTIRNKGVIDIILLLFDSFANIIIICPVVVYFATLKTSDLSALGVLLISIPIYLIYSVLFMVLCGLNCQNPLIPHAFRIVVSVASCLLSVVFAAGSLMFFGILYAFANEIHKKQLNKRARIYAVSEEIKNNSENSI